MIQTNTISCEMKTIQLYVDVGMQALCIQPESVWVRNGKAEVQGYTNQVVKPDVTSYAQNEKNQITALSNTQKNELNTLATTLKNSINTTGETKINSINNVGEAQINNVKTTGQTQTNTINTTANTHINNMQTLTTTARNWAIGSISEEASGSAKYWAQKANEVVNGIPSASESIAGKIKIATNAQAQAGTDNTTAMSPQKVMNNFVTLNTVQTINAVKTFTADIIRNINIDVTTSPTNSIYILPFVTQTSTQSLRAYQQIAYFTNGTITNSYGLRRTVNGSNILNSIEIAIDSNGNKSVNVVTPETTSNSKNIATTEWVNTFCKQTNHVVTEWSGNNSDNWYRKWPNGWIEQGGIISSGTADGNWINFSKTFYKPFTQTPSVFVNFLATQGEGYNCMKSLSATAFSFGARSTANNYHQNSKGITFYACGF